MNLEQAILCRVKELCQDHCISFEEFTAISGVDLTIYLAAGDDTKEEITIDTINQICETFNICAADFFNSNLFRNLKRK